MADVKLDHIITFANTSSIDAYLSFYKKEGFMVGKKLCVISPVSAMVLSISARSTLNLSG